MRLDLPADLAEDDMVRTLREMPVEEWAVDLHMFLSDLHVIQEELQRDADGDTLHSAAGISEAGPDDDVGLRLNTLDSMAGAVAAVSSSGGGCKCRHDRPMPVSASMGNPMQSAEKGNYPWLCLLK